MPSDATRSIRRDCGSCWHAIPGLRQIFNPGELAPGLASVISPSYNDLTSLIVKIDQNFNASNILTGRYFFGDSVQSFPLALAAARRPVARIQYLHSDPRATRFSVLRAHLWHEQGE